VALQSNAHVAALNLNAADKTEREGRKTQSNYTGSFHKPEVVMSPLHFQGEFTKM